jgi:hypothetical protein
MQTDRQTDRQRERGGQTCRQTGRPKEPRLCMQRRKSKHPSLARLGPSPPLLALGFALCPAAPLPRCPPPLAPQAARQKARSAHSEALSDAAVVPKISRALGGSQLHGGLAESRQRRRRGGKRSLCCAHPERGAREAGGRAIAASLLPWIAFLRAHVAAIPHSRHARSRRRASRGSAGAATVQHDDHRAA